MTNVAMIDCKCEIMKNHLGRMIIIITGMIIRMSTIIEMTNAIITIMSTLRWNSRCVGAQALGSPPSMLGQEVGKQSTMSVRQAMDRNQQCCPRCPFQGPRKNIDYWKKIGADNVLIQGILKGVAAPLHQVPKQQSPMQANGEDQLQPTIMEYLETNAIRPLTKEEVDRTRSWIPIFPREKKESKKVRMITDLRNLNNCHHVPRHRSENWKTVLETLSDPTAKWGMTIDLKSWFHHLEMRPDMARWMRFQHQGQGYQVQAMPFGWAMSPWWSQKLSKPIRALINQQGWLHCWFV